MLRCASIFTINRKWQNKDLKTFHRLDDGARLSLESLFPNQKN